MCGFGLSNQGLKPLCFGDSGCLGFRVEEGLGFRV